MAVMCTCDLSLEFFKRLLQILNHIGGSDHTRKDNATA